MIIKHEKVKEQIILVGPFAEGILLKMFEEDPRRKGEMISTFNKSVSSSFNDIEILRTSVLFWFNKENVLRAHSAHA